MDKEDLHNPKNTANKEIKSEVSKKNKKKKLLDPSC